MLVSIFYLPIFLILFKTQQRQAFWMTRTCINLKFVCVKFFGKTGRALAADLASVIVNHLKSTFRTLRTIYQKMWKMSVFGVFNIIINFITELVKKKKKKLFMTCCSWLDFLFSQKYRQVSIWYDKLAAQQFLYNRRSTGRVA